MRFALNDPIVSAYGPSLLVLLFNVIAKFIMTIIRESRLAIKRDYFYFGYPLIWTILGRAASKFIVVSKESVSLNKCQVKNKSVQYFGKIKNKNVHFLR